MIINTLIMVYNHNWISEEQPHSSLSMIRPLFKIITLRYELLRKLLNHSCELSIWKKPIDTFTDDLIDSSDGIDYLQCFISKLYFFCRNNSQKKTSWKKLIKKTLTYIVDRNLWLKKKAWNHCFCIANYLRNFKSWTNFMIEGQGPKFSQWEILVQIIIFLPLGKGGLRFTQSAHR